MRNRLYILFCVFYFIWSFGQTKNDSVAKNNPSINRINKMKIATGNTGNEQNIILPHIIKPTPESSFRTLFGNIPTNEYKGMQNLMLPLYTLNYGDIEIPITLKYAQIGVKVNDVPSEVGMSWILETGGVINRTVRDIPDELANERTYFNSLNDLLSIDTTDGTIDATLLNSFVSSPNIDKQVDYFNFIYPGNSGSFYLDENYKPVLITDNKECSITFNKNTYEFVITSNTGIQYFYGGQQATEETGKKVPYDALVKTSFYLTKVIDTKGNIVQYHYSTASPINYSPGTHEQVLKLVTGTTSPYMDFNVSVSGSQQIDVIKKEIYLNRIQTPIRLNRITTPEEEIVFNRINATFPPTKVTGIEISYQNLLHKEIDFEYLTQKFSNNEQRFWLTGIKHIAHSEGNSTKIEEYKLTYEDPLAIPNRGSFNVDYMGYYNGAYNSNLIPNTDLFHNTLIGYTDYNIPVQLKGSANRVPNFEYTKKGALLSINYPTGGKSEFEYEPIFAREKIDNPIMLNSMIEDPNQSSSSLEINGADMDGTTMEIVVTGGSAIQSPTIRKFTLEILDSTTGSILFSKINFLKKLSLETIHDTIDFQVNKNTKYLVRYTMQNNCAGCSGFLIITGHNRSWQKVEDRGIRLKRQQDYDGSKIVNIRRYYYNKYSDINNIMSLKEKFKPYFYYFTMWTALATEGSFSPTNPFFELSGNMYYLKSEPTIEYFLDDPDSFLDPVFDEITISYGGDNFEKGGIEETFTNAEINQIGIIGLPHDAPFSHNGGDSVSLLNGQLNNMIRNYQQKYRLMSGKPLNIKFISNKNGSLYLRKEIVNQYSQNETKEIFNLFGTKVYDKIFYPPGVEPGTTTSNLFLGYFSLDSYFVNLIKTITTEYLEDIPLNSDPNNFSAKIQKVDSFIFDNLNHNQITSSKSKSTTGDEISTTYQYAHEKNNQYLIDKNMIGIPLETKVTKKVGSVTKTIADTETKYPTSQTEANSKTNGLPLPYSVISHDLQTASATNTQLTYDQYDPSNGNLLQYSDKGLMPTAIIWGYHNTQPIAKVEGATYAQVSSLAAAIVTASDTDAGAAPGASETSLLNALNTFRNNSTLAGYQITTYTYDPLIGVRSITPPSGITEFYEYDTANRLKTVKDVNGNILKEYQYHYKP